MCKRVYVCCVCVSMCECTSTPERKRVRILYTLVFLDATYYIKITRLIFNIFSNLI